MGKKESSLSSRQEEIIDYFHRYETYETLPSYIWSKINGTQESKASIGWNELKSLLGGNLTKEFTKYKIGKKELYEVFGGEAEKDIYQLLKNRLLVSDPHESSDYILTMKGVKL